MELKHDWRAFNSVLFPHESITVGRDEARRLVVVEDAGHITDGIVSSGAWFKEGGFDKGEELADMSKERLDGLASKYDVDQTVTIERRALDQAIGDAAALGSNYYQQLQFIREKVQDMVNGAGTNRKRRATAMISRSHFVLELLNGKLARFLPKSYNFLIFIDQSAGGTQLNYKALLLSYAQGKLDAFFEPDFSSLHENRLEEWSKHTDTIGEYLESRYILPCYGIFVTKAAWERCVLAAAQGRNPWRQFMKACDSGQASAYPQNVLTKTLLASQKVMVYFTRE